MRALTSKDENVKAAPGQEVGGLVSGLAGGGGLECSARGGHVPLRVRRAAPRDAAMASKRIIKELKDLQKDPPSTCSAGMAQAAGRVGCLCSP